MRLLHQLFDNNRRWSAERRAEDPEFFARLAALQTPPYLWIGCSDSRVPANDIVGLLPGELFVHRNVANVVVHTDLNCLSVIQYAVDVLKVQHVMVVGHYNCGGVRAVLDGGQFGLIDNWLRHVEDVRSMHADLVAAVPPGPERVNRLCELNVLEQAANVSETTIVRDAWARGQPLAIHGWVYGLEDGLLRDLGFAVNEPGAVDGALSSALAALAEGRTGRAVG